MQVPVHADLSPKLIDSFIPDPLLIHPPVSAAYSNPVTIQTQSLALASSQSWLLANASDCQLFNRSLEHGVVPSTFKSAYITPLLKRQT